MAIVSMVLAFGLAGCGSEPDQSDAAGGLPAGLPALLPASREMLAGPWQATPFSIDPRLRTEAERACRNSGMDPFPNVTLMVIDARGEGVLQAQFAGLPGSTASCMDMTIRDDGLVEALGGGSTGGGMAFRPLQQFELQVDGKSGGGGGGIGPGAGGPGTVQVSGRVGPGIAQVRILAPGQPPIVASLQNGWFLAWWHGSFDPVTVVGLDALGNQVAEAPG
jgi:hypothetical protein